MNESSPAAPPLLRAIDCIQLFVPDLDAGLAFYRDTLGHALLWRTPTAAGLRLPGSNAELVLQTERPRIEIDMQVDAADAAAERFRAAGGTIIVQPFDIPIGRCVVVRDPWGNDLVLLDTSKGLLTTDEHDNVLGVVKRKDG